LLKPEYLLTGNPFASHVWSRLYMFFYSLDLPFDFAC
jgi:hypothetical protein